MENKSFKVNPEELEVVDGKVIISSEELAMAIQSKEVDFGLEEEAEGIVGQQNGCINLC